jgi:hypothetical protein
MDAEEKAVRAADENVDIVEQAVQYLASRPTGPRLSPDMHISAHPIATDTAERIEHAGQEEEAIPEWVITESRENSREVTPPDQLFFRDQGKRQKGNCGPAAVIGTLYYVYCTTGVKRAELESLLTYRAIRQFATTHLQQQTILTAAQVDDTQMEGCQKEVYRFTQDLWTQKTILNADTDPYAVIAAWVWEQIAQPESPEHKRQAIWWSDLVVALVIKAVLRLYPADPSISTQALAAAQSLRTTAGEGTLDLMLLNATHGVLIIADTVLNLPRIQAQCAHFQVIIVVSREKNIITYYRRTRLLTEPNEEDGRLWLQELKMKRPLVDILQPE